MLVKQNGNVRLVIPVLLLGCLVGCSASSPKTSATNPTPTAPADPWLITNLDSNVETPALLWNGLVGVRWNGRFGAGPKGVNEHYDIEHFQRTGEEKIVQSVGHLAFEAFVDKEQLLPDKSGDFVSRLDLKAGTVTDTWTQFTSSGGQTQVKVEFVMHPTKRAISQRWTIQPEKPAGVFVQIRPDLILSTDRPSADDSMLAGFQSVASNSFERKIGPFTWVVKDSIPLQDGKVFERVATCDQGSKDSFADIASAAKSYLSKQWVTDIEIDGPVEDQQFIRSALFYLRSSIHPSGKMSVSPMGLSSDIYSGHIFWDADIWVYPALALVDPAPANAIPQYRLSKLDQATKNGIDWLKANRPTGKAPLGSIEKDIVDIAKFPWESSVSGKETVPGPSKFQDHISGSVAWSSAMANSLGYTDPRLLELQRKVKNFYLFRSQKNSDGLFELKGTMSPDEHHIGDNDLYTNLLAMWVTNGGKWPAKPTHKLPQDDKTFLTYDNDGLRGYKQAAAVLSIYPLQYPPAEKQARVMMERFADKVTKNGPAMTDSIHSIIWSRLGEKGKAYQAWHDSWKPFVKPPFLLFSEKRNSIRTYFTTGAAGSLQAVLYGFAGIRIDNKKAPNAQWSIPLKNGQILSIAPNLPKEWKKLTLRNLTILGKKYTFEIEGDRVKVSTTK